MSPKIIKIKQFILLPAVLILVSCIYRPQIIQGSIIKDELEELKIGMSKEQVQYILGSPSIINSLNQSRWDYIYHIRNKKGKLEIIKGYLIFDKDTLAEIHLDEYKR